MLQLNVKAVTQIRTQTFQYNLCVCVCVCLCVYVCMFVEMNRKALKLFDKFNYFTLVEQVTIYVTY